METTKGFLQSLFDFRFKEFITVRIISVLYGLSIICSALIALVLIILGFSFSVSAGILMLLIGAPLTFFLNVIYTRLLLEVIVIIFRIEEHTSKIAEQGQSAS